MLTSKDVLGLGRAHAESESSSFLYGLIDHAGMPGLAKKFAQSPISWVSLLSGTDDKTTLPVAPLLFEIDSNANLHCRAVYEWIGQQGTYTSTILFLASPLAIGPLSTRLAMRLDATLPEDMDVMLRYFDPRIFEQLVKSFTAIQKQTFLSVATDWWFVDRRGDLQKVDATFNETDNHVSPLIFSAAQEAELIDASEPDQVARIVESFVPDLYRAIPIQRRHDFVLRQMDDARRINIQSSNDLAMHCMQALLYGENFATSKNWASTLQQVQSGKINLQQAVDLIETTTTKE